MQSNPLVTLVSPSGTAAMTPCAMLKDSHTSPIFSNVVVRLESLRTSPDGQKLLARLFISGTVQSVACELAAGSAATIREVTVHIKWDYAGTIPTHVTKASVWNSFEHPYPMTATFSAEIEAEYSTGTIGIELRATDTAGLRLTGFVLYSQRIDVESDRAEVTAQDARITRHTVGTWTFLAWEPTLVAQSSGGECHIYYVRLCQGPGLQPKPTGDQRSLLALGPDNEFYLAGPDQRPQPNVLVTPLRPSPTDPLSGITAGTFESGFLEGMVFERTAFATGCLYAELKQQSGGVGGVDICLAVEAAHRLGVTHRRLGTLGSRVSDFSHAVQAVYDYAAAVNSQQLEIISLVAALKWKRLYSESRELAVMGQYLLEVLEGIHKEIGPARGLATVGKIQGRLCCETLQLLAGRDPSAASKEKTLSDLQKSKSLNEHLRSLFDRILTFWRSLPFG